MMNTLHTQGHRHDAHARLRRSRRLAGSLLLLAAALFALAVYYQPRYPLLGYLKAFSEAAMVGGLADWFAVTALFRRPLGLPIPHTAILPRKQARIADELGRFVADNFLQGKSIALRVYQARLADKALIWLANEDNRARWLPWLAARMPVLLRVLKPNQAARFGSRLLAECCTGRQLGETLANVLSLLCQQQLDRLLLRALLQEVRHWLQGDKTRRQLEHSLLAWAGKMEHEAPSTWDKIKATLKTTLAGQVDDWVAGRALDWADGYLAAALQDGRHPLWQAYERHAAAAVTDLRHNRVWHRRLQAGKRQLATSEALHRTLAQGWQSLCRWSQADVQRTDSQWQTWLTCMLAQAQRHPQWLRRANMRLAWWVKQLVAHHQHQGARFVADRVKSWDSRQMVRKLELSVGRDLQFIRINGTLVGGVAGLLIYALAQWLAPA